MQLSPGDHPHLTMHTGFHGAHPRILPIRCLDKACGCSGEGLFRNVHRGFGQRHRGSAGTGCTPSSGDKNGLFLAALEHYQAHVARPMWTSSNNPAPRWPRSAPCSPCLPEFSRQPGGKLGCLVFNSVKRDGPARRGHRRQNPGSPPPSRAGTSTCLPLPSAKANCPAGFTSARKRTFLFGVLHALPVMARARRRCAMKTNVVSVALSTLA